MADERLARRHAASGTAFRQCRQLARTAAAVVGADLVGVDLLPVGGGAYVVLELNAAVDFDEQYALGDANVYDEIANALRLGHDG